MKHFKNAMDYFIVNEDDHHRQKGWYPWGPEIALTQSLLSVHKAF